MGLVERGLIAVCLIECPLSRAVQIDRLFARHAPVAAREVAVRPPYSSGALPELTTLHANPDFENSLAAAAWHALTLATLQRARPGGDSKAGLR